MGHNMFQSNVLLLCLSSIFMTINCSPLPENDDESLRGLNDLGNGHLLRKRAFRGLGSGNLLRSMDGIGEGHLLRSMDSLGRGHLLRSMGLGGGHLLRSM